MWWKDYKTIFLDMSAITALQLIVWVNTTGLNASHADEDTKTEVRKKFLSFLDAFRNLCEEFGVHVKPDAVHYVLFTPSHVPLPLRPKGQEEFKHMESIGVISRLDEPTAWCAGIVVVPKKEGAIHICVDLKLLNCMFFVKYTHFQK